MPVTFGTVPPFFVGFVLVVIMPLVSFVMTVADKFLTRRRAAKMFIIPPVLVDQFIAKGSPPYCTT